MIFLLLVLSNVVLAVIFKFFEKFRIDNLNAIVVNYFTCVVSSSIFMGHQSVPSDFYAKPWFGSSILLSLLFIVGFNLMALSFQKAGLALTAIIQKMSLLLSAGFAIIFYNEVLTTYKFIGFVAAVVTIILVNYPSNGQKIELKNRWLILLPLIVFLLSGLIEILLFYVEVSGQVDGDGMYFTATSFGLAGCIGSLIVLIRVLTGRSTFGLKDFIGGIILGLPNYLSIYLLVYLLANNWEGSVLFPLNNVSILLMVTFIGALFYKEKLDFFKVLGMGFGIIAIVLIGSGL